MWSNFYLLFILYWNFNYINTNENEFHLYMDNQTLCNQEIIYLKNIPIGRIYSHIDYHNKYFYFPDNHCTITIQTKKRIWMSLEYFQSNSSSSFPRCIDGKYAGNDDRLQIIDGYKNGSILRIICGKDTDKSFDRTPLILKSSIFTIDWQTKSQSFGFELKFILYDLAIDGQCLNSNQFQCKNKRCIDKSLICYDEDYCGDKSYENSLEKNSQCIMKIAKQKTIHSYLIFILIIFCCCCLFLLLIIFSNQVLTQSFEDIDNNNNQHIIPLCGCFYSIAQLEQIGLNKDNNDQTENIDQNVLKLIKRRPQPKFNLAGLWGVPTRFA
ncbi:unnamed protein product [Rotaria sordida]|uniref:CUB domain-containing protein n=1 Tax=Rotaria sordida TaxID=392033 RepID=A0A818YLB0_9BILA|nr:unnamed protein product [Rotaria sordida]